MMAHAADPATDLKTLPAGLPDPVVNTRKLWHPVAKLKTPASGLFALPCFPDYDEAARKRILWCLHYHRRAVRGWVKVVLGQGGNDPWATVRARMREVLLRTDLWSDQMLVLRAVQSLTMLDVQHTCDLVWSLGGYAHHSSSRIPPAPATESRKPADPATSAIHDVADPSLDANGGLWPSADPVGNPHQSGNDPGTS